MLESFIKRFPRERMLSEDWVKSVDTLDNCADCGQCEKKCPYHLQIRALMAKQRDKYVAWRKGEAR